VAPAGKWSGEVESSRRINLSLDTVPDRCGFQTHMVVHARTRTCSTQLGIPAAEGLGGGSGTRAKEEEM
jgi:hypothetical protein